MIKRISSALKTTPLVLALILSFGLSYAYASWTEPAGAPPSANADAPINAGATAQTKTGALTAGTLTSTGNVSAAGSVTASNGLSVSNAGGLYTYITLHDDESPNGVKYIHANSNVIGFLNGIGSWIQYWNDNGDSYQVGNSNANDYYIRSIGKWASSLGGGGSAGRLYQGGSWASNSFYCDPGYTLVGYHFDCGCSNNANWYACVK